MRIPQFPFSENLPSKAIAAVEETSEYLSEALYVVWFSKTLQNWKALVSSTNDVDSAYWEVTYNGDKKETYVDRYVKVSNTAV